MSNFFRKKRKSLADENRLFKYARYAIGEIVLVVIGILIALNINNWNDTRLKKNAAISLSERLLKETKRNKKLLKKQINRVYELQDETQSLLNLFGTAYTTKDEYLLDSLLYGLISTPLYEYNASTLDEALNTGQVSILPSDSIRSLLYEIPQKMIQINNYEEEMTREIENNLMPFLYNEISLRQMDERFSDNLKRKDKNQLLHFDNRIILTKRKFENMVDNKYFLLETLLIGYHDLSLILNKTIALIDKELKK